MKDQINKKNLLYGIGGGILGSALGASGIIILSSFEGPAITNTIALIGGLGGGAISGGLTLWGVKHTIKAQRKKDELEIFPKWIMTLDKIKEVLKTWEDSRISFVSQIQNFNNIPKRTQLRIDAIDDFQVSIKKLTSELLPHYLQADGNIYAKVKGFLNELEVIVADMKEIEDGPKEYSLEELQRLHGEKILDLNTKTRQLQDFLQKKLETYEESLFNYYN
ncbi:hypothetical protein [Bacillus sp. GMs2/1]|uniref:hypothetical protein n=1 Tax=Bacillus sp. GMs2/1 TaxID=3418493 RepID=UPI003CFBA44D